VVDINRAFCLHSESNMRKGFKFCADFKRNGNLFNYVPSDYNVTNMIGSIEICQEPYQKTEQCLGFNRLIVEGIC
jgi:hypothetical protein